MEDEREHTERGSDQEGDDESEDDGLGLTDEARSRGGKNSSEEQQRDERGRFIGKD